MPERFGKIRKDLERFGPAAGGLLRYGKKQDFSDFTRRERPSSTEKSRIFLILPVEKGHLIRKKAGFS